MFLGSEMLEVPFYGGKVRRVLDDDDGRVRGRGGAYLWGRVLKIWILPECCVIAMNNDTCTNFVIEVVTQNLCIYHLAIAIQV